VFHQLFQRDNQNAHRPSRGHGAAQSKVHGHVIILDLLNYF